jgi:hypothetical protein
LPAFLRFPYCLALVVFDWFAVFRHGRRFRALNPDQRAAYVTAWSERGVAMTRDVLKLVRVCALLRYFDHPLVIAGSDGIDSP